MSIAARKAQRVSKASKRIVVYFPGYSRASTGNNNTSIANLNWNSFSHIVDFSKGMDAGRLSHRWHPDGDPVNYTTNGWSASQATALCAAGKANNRKVLLGVGAGNTMDSWNANLDTSAKRTQIINDIISDINTYGYDGVDFDGEPGYRIDNYQLFVQEVITAFTAQGWRNKNNSQYKIVSAALFGSETALAKSLILTGCDWVGAMLYTPSGSTPGKHISPIIGTSSLYGDSWQTWVMNQWCSGTNAIPKSKVLPGVSYYACAWLNCAGPGLASTSKSFKKWYVVASMMGGIDAPNATWYPASLAHGMVSGSDWYSFETKPSLQAKSDYLFSNKLGGMIVWCYQDGSLGGANHPLAGAMQDIFQQYL